jgi:eukaryotic-like serine/threonine-protein kinase
VFEGAQIGGYRLLRQIGEGGMGAVWMAEHDVIGRRAAIKILHQKYSTQRKIVTRFFNEARAATAISDPGIIQIFDVGVHKDGSAYIVMELLEGEPLNRRLERRITLPAEEALRICRQIASAVGAAHARGIVHRDLKPENIFLVRDSEVPGGERAKVLDFGIAKLAGDLGAQQKTSPSLIMGTPTYMSPEQCRGAGNVDRRSDVYSLGCLLYALVTGRTPFDAKGSGDLIVQHITELPVRPSLRAPVVSAELDALILCCLEKNPEDRFSSGTELAMAIDALLGRPPQITEAIRTAPISPVALNATTLGASATAATAIVPAARRARGKLYFGLAAAIIGGGGATAMFAARGPAEPEGGHATATAEPVPADGAPTPTPQPPPVDPRPAQVRADMRALLAAFSRWAPDHAGAPCPTSAELGRGADPWGHAYELTCTDQPADQVAGVRSLGPDGAPATDDDLTSWTSGRDVTELARGKRWTPSPMIAKPIPPVSAPGPATSAAQPKPAPGKPPPRKPAPAPAAKPTEAGGIIDTDGDGIPDSR